MGLVVPFDRLINDFEFGLQRQVNEVNMIQSSLDQVDVVVHWQVLLFVFCLRLCLARPCPQPTHACHFDGICKLST